MRVKYVGPAKDYSGYGEAVRHDIAALNLAGIDISTEIPVYTLDASDYGKLGQIALNAENKEIGYKVKILHTTPNVYRSYMEPEKYHIGRAFWETDKVPLDFAGNLNEVDEIWTGSKYNEQAIRNAGVHKPPIYIIPEAIDDTLDIKQIQPYITENKDEYTFYSIFEWTERKNPKGLLEAYWRAFTTKDKVRLVIKTYVDNFKQEKKDEIKQGIKKLKLKLGLTEYAPVYLFTELMSRNQIYRFHKTGDCFVSLHRGEGWGIPQMEAMLMERPIISTNCGGIHEYLTHEKDALLVNWTAKPVENTRNQHWYTPDQHWADADVKQASELMRWVFDNKKKAQEIGKNARQTVIKNFGLQAVGQKMRKRLLEIVDSLSVTTI
jgi:glycosyltransferase involved in cell wall biosynthesis